jgi:hypothetical protein
VKSGVLRTGIAIPTMSGCEARSGSIETTTSIHYRIDAGRPIQEEPMEALSALVCVRAGASRPLRGEPGHNTTRFHAHPSPLFKANIPCGVVASRGQTVRWPPVDLALLRLIRRSVVSTGTMTPTDDRRKMIFAGSTHDFRAIT